MRKVIAIALLLMLVMAGCGAQTNTDTTPIPTFAAPAPTPKTADIGFCLAGSDDFTAQLKQDIETECAARDYQVEIITSVTASGQQEDILSLLAMDVSVIVIEPVDVDALEAALAECGTRDVRVINIVDMINGEVSMLISPDYKKAGRAAAEAANGLSAGGTCLMLGTSMDSFVSQLLSDGFAGDLASGITVTGTYCGDDTQTACDAVKEALQQNAGLIFAQSAALGKGAVQAMDDTGSDVPLIVFGGDMETIESVATGDIDAAVFFGPAETAKQAVYYADEMMKNSAFAAPQYVELTAEAVDADNVSDYQTDAPHAQVKGNAG